jgi:hypothetical protein
LGAVERVGAVVDEAGRDEPGGVDVDEGLCDAVDGPDGSVLAGGEAPGATDGLAGERAAGDRAVGRDLDEAVGGAHDEAGVRALADEGQVLGGAGLALGGEEGLDVADVGERLGGRRGVDEPVDGVGVATAGGRGCCGDQLVADRGGAQGPQRAGAAGGVGGGDGAVDGAASEADAEPDAGADGGATVVEEADGHGGGHSGGQGHVRGRGGVLETEGAALGRRAGPVARGEGRGPGEEGADCEETAVVLKHGAC